MYDEKNLVEEEIQELRLIIKQQAERIRELEREVNTQFVNNLIREK